MHSATWQHLPDSASGAMDIESSALLHGGEREQEEDEQLWRQVDGDGAIFAAAATAIEPVHGLYSAPPPTQQGWSGSLDADQQHPMQAQMNMEE